MHVSYVHDDGRIARRETGRDVLLDDIAIDTNPERMRVYINPKMDEMDESFYAASCENEIAVVNADDQSSCCGGRDKDVKDFMEMTKLMMYTLNLSDDIIPVRKDAHLKNEIPGLVGLFATPKVKTNLVA